MFRHHSSVSARPDGVRIPSRSHQRYMQAELEIQKEPGAQAVLVSVASLTALRRAYPNYFLDIDEFLTAMRTAIGE